MLPTKLALKVGEKNIPIGASFELTYACNQRCLHCYQPSHERVSKELTTDQIKDVLDQLVEAGCLFLALTGGEPLMREDFWQIAEHAHERSFAMTLQTNGTLLSPAAINRLRELNFLQVHISLLGVREDTHDKITRCPGSFKRAVTVAEALREAKLTVILKITLMKENVGELEQVEELARKLDCLYLLSPTIFPTIDGGKQPLEHRVSDLDLRKIFSGRWRAQMKHYVAPRRPKSNLPLCGMGKTDCCVSPQGKLYPCVGVPIVLGDLRKKKFIDIWANSEKLKWLRSLTIKDLKICQNCDLAYLCVRCTGLAYLEEGDVLLPSLESCRTARAIKEVIDSENKKKI